MKVFLFLVVFVTAIFAFAMLMAAEDESGEIK